MDEKFISMKEAAELLGVKRPSLYHYVAVLNLEKHRFTLDRETYLTWSDFEIIRALKEKEAARKSTTRKSAARKSVSHEGELSIA